jgi:predicted flap endonuclease-1-like 5' DNA nuclease
MTDIADPAAARERALKSLVVPLGLANPLWLCFGAAASAGACWWLMSRLAKPFNAEAFFAGAAPAKAAPLVAEAEVAAKVIEATPPVAVDERTPETAPVVLEVALEVAPTLVEAAEAPVEAVLEAVHDTIEAETAAVEEIAAEAEAEVEDDLTLMVGVGPRTARALIDRGVTRFAHLAAWSEGQMAAFDHELNLKGRSVRDAWLKQAKRLAKEA